MMLLRFPYRWTSPEDGGPEPWPSRTLYANNDRTRYASAGRTLYANSDRTRSAG